MFLFVNVTFSLDKAPVGEPVTLVLCLVEPALRSRLSTLGLRCGAKVEVIRSTKGHAIVGVAGARIALDRTVLSKLHARGES